MAARWFAVGLVALVLPEQVVAPRDVAAEIAVDVRGGAFLVSPSTRRGARTPVRARFAAPGERFGPPRTVMPHRRRDRVMDAGVAADGSGLIVVQRGSRVRVVTFAPRRARTISPPHAHADFAASAMAGSGAAAVVWFRHRRDGRWRLEVALREPGASAFGAPQPVSRYVRRPCCTSVSVAIGERGHAVATWTSTSRPSVWAAQRRPGRAFRRPQRLARDASDVPRAVVGAGGEAALLYSVQNVPLRPRDGLQLHRAVSGGSFGAAEQVNPGQGGTIGEAAITPGGATLVAWLDGAGSVRVSEAGPGAPLADAGSLGRHVAPQIPAVAADDERAVVAWSERVSTASAHFEQAHAAMRRAPGASFGPAVALGRAWRAALPGQALLVPHGGALVSWNGYRYGARADRRAVLAVTRLP
jgi:hypothetical protein